MSNTKLVISMLTVFFLACLPGIVCAEFGEVNGTNNLSQAGNISVNETNQSYEDHDNRTYSDRTNQTDNDGSGGGIKKFMKSYTFQSGA